MSKTKTNAVPIPFKLVSITTEDFSSAKEFYIEEEENYSINFGFEIAIDDNNRIISLFTKFDFQQNLETVLSLKSACHFELKEDFWNEQLQNKVLTLPAPFLTHLLVICVGTARGIFHEIKPQWASQFILPTMNVSQVINEDITFELVS